MAKWFAINQGCTLPAFFAATEFDVSTSRISAYQSSEPHSEPPLQNVEDLDPIEFVRTIAATRIHARISLGAPVCWERANE